jgi:curved DNA-binding protein CbpA
MDIRHCYETLELTPDASVEDVKQAYRDLVNIWHPDRVSNNPRLKQKAEEKLKQINTAYEGLLSHLNGQSRGTKAVEKAPIPKAEENRPDQEAPPYSDSGGRSETPVKKGFGIVSTLWSSLSDFLHNLSVNRVPAEGGRDDQSRSPRAGQGYRQDRGVGKGRGADRGRSGRGVGRGKGMGRGKGRR